MANEWTPWEFALPEGEVEWRRRYWNSPNFVAAWKSFYPEFNVHGLEWRPLKCRLDELGLTVD